MTAAALAAALLFLSADPATKPLVCKGEKPGDKKTQALRKTVEAGETFKFAVEQLGAPKSCTVEWGKTVLGVDSTLVYRLGDKGGLTYFTPQDSSTVTLAAEGGFPDETAIRAFLKRAKALEQFQIDWKKKPKVSELDGMTTETYDSASDDGTGVTLHSKGGKLFMVMFSFLL